ncbi:MAG: hypothetical protein HKM28_04370 [Flavobacteriaceae bacterium]|nr:hypothetical protein [Flavobacteriaceae bacterium]
MNKSRIYRHSIPLLLLLFFAQLGIAQEQKTESFPASEDMLVIVQTTHTNVVFETWNKDKVEIEASVDGEGLTSAEKKEILENWDYRILGNSNQVIVTSNGGGYWNGMESLSSLGQLQSFQELEFLGPMMEEMINPLIMEITSKDFPKELFKNMEGVDFDYEQFQKDEEGYMKKFEAEMKKKFGKDYQKKMEAWGNDFAKRWEEERGPEFEERMKEWEEKYAEKMEAWGENLEKEMEEWAKQFEENMEKNKGDYAKKVITSPNGNKTIIMQSSNPVKMKELKAVKTLIIRMPKNTKTEINVRHGEIKMADVFNVKATLNYSPFTANSIDGGETLINAAYAPVVVNNWNRGTLYVKFVENCSLENVRSITLRGNSSDVLIGTILQDAQLTGSLGNFSIANISKDFRTVKITLRNNDLKLSVPATSLSFDFTGKKSTLQYPKSLQLTSSKQDDKVKVKGFNFQRNPNRTLSIDALYSNVKAH